MDTIPLICRLVHDGTSRLSLSFSNDIDVTEEVLKTNIIQTSIIELSLEQGNVNVLETSRSLDCLLHFKHLVHLNIMGCKLRGSLGALNHMQIGLKIVRLADCLLINSDLEELIGSCHQLTLEQLELDNNQFSYDSDVKVWNKLCQNLINTQILSLSHCDILTLWPSSNIEDLFYSFNSMPKLMMLDLRECYHNTDIIQVNALVLSKSPSLRMLKLSVPLSLIKLEVSEDMVRSFCQQMNEKINNLRSQVLYIDFEYQWRI